MFLNYYVIAMKPATNLEYGEITVKPSHNGQARSEKIDF